MTITSDETAVWVFYLKNTINDVVRNSINNFVSTGLLIDILIEESLLIPTEIIFLGITGNKENILINKDNNSSDILTKIMRKLNFLGNGYVSFLIRGKTSLLINESKKDFDNILEVGVELSSYESRFYINTYSDCWVPIDRDDNVQVELAIDASSRLEKCLKKIDLEILLESRFPALNEECEGMYILPQKGNRVYTKSKVNNTIYKDIIDMKFFWENRDIY
ncbi:hypothetical protein [Tenacibaculum halocynthiae]|uniref:hypothetical protein n=1 Tax=Tenacibaculum halocynthiae TaxID=1254437 RepID=UPI003D65F161